MPITEDYNSTYTGPEIDSAVGRALPDGAIDQSLANRVRYDAAQSLTTDQMAQARENIGAEKSTVLGTITRNKIYKIGTYAAGSGNSDVGTVCIRIWDASDYANKNYMLIFSSATGNLAEFHGMFNYNYLCSISVYTDPNTTGRSKIYTIFASTQNYVDLASVSIENEHNFSADFIDVTDTFLTITSGLEKVWESIYERENPPLQLGVEYRTTERYLGKPVYVKLVDCGQLPNATEKTISAYAENVERVVDFNGISPYFGQSLMNKNFTTLSVAIGWINIACTTDLSAGNAEVWVKYTKTTD